MLRVYAIIGNRRGRRASGRRLGPGIRLVTAGRIAAVVADGEEKTEQRPLSARALRAHDAVIRRIARVEPAVLPARFGTIVPSDRSLADLLKHWSRELLAALALVNRHEQMTLRVFGPDGRAGHASGQAPGVVVPDEDGSGTGYLRRRARAYAEPETPELEPLRAALAPLVAAERIARHDRGPLVLTVYHLIPRGRAAAYRRLLRRHAADLGNRAVTSGPWPPYAFVPELRR